MILPGAHLGVFGGGQLGRMFVVAARTMGYRTVVFDPDSDSPAGQIADQHLCAGYDDEAALNRFAKTCAAITIEFESIPVDALNKVRENTRLSPAANVLSIVQDRYLEKQFLREIGVETVSFHRIMQASDIAAAATLFQSGAILKTTRLGYDGRGQRIVGDEQAAQRAFLELSSCACIIEEKIDFICELSVVAVRAEDGTVACYPPTENTHHNGILHTSKIPASCSAEVISQAQKITQKIADSLDYCGVLAVEFFLPYNEKLVVNEIAPRPHNSGHYTMDACVVSQFEQQVRMMCGFTPGSVRLLSPVVMMNILGDVWGGDDAPPDWQPILNSPDTKLHLYGKHAVRNGRKMGHFCVLDSDPIRAEQRASELHTQLIRRQEHA